MVSCTLKNSSAANFTAVLFFGEMSPCILVHVAGADIRLDPITPRPEISSCTLPEAIMPKAKMLPQILLRGPGFAGAGIPLTAGLRAHFETPTQQACSRRPPW